MAAQGQPAPFDIDVLPDAIHRIHTFIDSDGTDEDVSGWILGNDFVDFVSAVLSSSYDEVRTRWHVPRGMLSCFDACVETG
jgi:hypothetical protein